MSPKTDVEQSKLILAEALYKVADACQKLGDFIGAKRKVQHGEETVVAATEKSEETDNAVKAQSPPMGKRSMYTLFAKDQRSKVKSKYPDMDVKQINAEIKKLFQALSGEEKEKYERLADEDKARFDKEITDYNSHQPQGDAVKQPGNKKAKTTTKATPKKTAETGNKAAKGKTEKVKKTTEETKTQPAPKKQSSESLSEVSSSSDSSSTSSSSSSDNEEESNSTGKKETKDKESESDSDEESDSDSDSSSSSSSSEEDS